MVELTLLEVDATGATVTVNTPLSGDKKEFEVALDDGGSIDPRPIAALIGLVFLVVLAVVVKRRLGG